MVHLENRDPVLRRILPEAFINGDELVWAVFAASGEFSRIAWDSLESPAQRIIGRDGQQISMMILKEHIGFRSTDEGESSFNISDLKDYLNRRSENFPIL